MRVNTRYINSTRRTSSFTPLCADSARVLRASFCFRLVTRTVDASKEMTVSPAYLQCVGHLLDDGGAVVDLDGGGRLAAHPAVDGHRVLLWHRGHRLAVVDGEDGDGGGVWNTVQDTGICFSFRVCVCVCVCVCV